MAHPSVQYIALRQIIVQQIFNFSLRWMFVSHRTLEKFHYFGFSVLACSLTSFEHLSRSICSSLFVAVHRRPLKRLLEDPVPCIRSCRHSVSSHIAAVELSTCWRRFSCCLVRAARNMPSAYSKFHVGAFWMSRAIASTTLMKRNGVRIEPWCTSILIKNSFVTLMLYR